MTLLDFVTDVALVVLITAVLLFIGFYGKYSPWRTTWQGQFLMTQKVAMALLAGHFLIVAIWPYPGFRVVQALLICFLAITAALMLFGLLLAQTEDRPVSRHHGTGFVPSDEVESTLQTRQRKAGGRRG